MEKLNNTVQIYQRLRGGTGRVQRVKYTFIENYTKVHALAMHRGRIQKRRANCGDLIRTGVSYIFKIHVNDPFYEEFINTRITRGRCTVTRLRVNFPR